MAVAVGDIWLVSAVGVAFGQRILNTYHYQTYDNTGGLTEEAFADALAAAFSPTPNDPDSPSGSLLECLPPEYVLAEIWVQKIFPVRYRKNVYLRGLPGNYDGETTLTNVAAVITRQGPFAGRDQISSLHIGPIDVSGNFAQEGKLTTDGFTKMGLHAATLIENLPLGGGGMWAAEPGIFHVGEAPGTNFTPIVDTIVQDTTRVMRRRTVRLGE